MKNNESSSNYVTFLFCIGVMFYGALPSYSQGHKSSSFAADREIYLKVEHASAKITITSDPSITGLPWPVTIDSLDHLGDTDYSWGGSFSCEPSPNFSFSCNTRVLP